MAPAGVCRLTVASLIANPRRQRKSVRGTNVSIALAVVVGLSGGVRAQSVDDGADHGRTDIAAQTSIVVGAVARVPVNVVRTAAEAASIQSASNTKQNWPARHPVLLGTLVGMGVGAAIGAATCKYPGAEGPCSYYTFPGNARALGALTIGGVGGGLGAVAGAIVSGFLR